MLKAVSSRPILLLVVLVLAMLTFSNESIPVSIMEARNFITAREMVHDGNWLLTTMNGEARYEKPPLPTWLTALSGLLFGLKSLTAFRLPAIVFVAIIGAFIFLLSKKLLNNATHSFINALIGITSFYVIGIVFEAPWDIFTHGFMLIAICYLVALFGKNGGFLLHGLMAGLFIGCSFLCKGPISVYALLLPFLIAYGLTYRYTGLRSRWASILLCVLLAALIGGWWYVYVRVMDPETFISIAERETNNWHSYNTKPLYYYWSFFTQSGIWTIPAFIGLLYPYLKNRVSNPKAYQFSLIWTLSAVILLSLVPEKKSRYLMPVLIPMAINTGFYIEYLIRRFKQVKDIRELLPVYFNFGVIALVSFGFPIALYFFMGDGLNGHWTGFVISATVNVLIGILILFYLKEKNIRNVFLLTVAFFVSVFIFALPIMKSSIGRQNNPISTKGHEDLTIYGLNYVSPEIIWYFGDKIRPLKSEDGQYHFPTEDRFGILGNNLNEKDWNILRSRYHVDEKETFDLNPATGGRYNDRLVNTLYILTKL